MVNNPTPPRRVVHEPPGFTLVELLVAILVLGVLAALAIPTLLQTRHSASDTSAKTMATTARLAARMLALDNGGSFATVSKSRLHEYEPTIATKKGEGDTYLSAASGTQSTYLITVVSTGTGDKFTITRRSDGTAVRTCKIAKGAASSGGCTVVKGVNGTW